MVVGKPASLKSILKTTCDASALVVTDPDWFGPVEWLMDTGSSVDLVGNQDIPMKYMQYVEDVSNPIHLSTANGRLCADKAIYLQVGSLGNASHHSC